MRFVIVGAGSAGCVLANRLTSSGEHEVTLIEAGPDYGDAQPHLGELPDEDAQPHPGDLLGGVPAGSGGFPSDLLDGRQNSLRQHDWGLEHRVNSKQGIRFPYPRGRVVGGSSAVNTCIALRPQPYDINEWGARGLGDWTWEKCLPALRRLETDLDFPNHPEHGASGPLRIRRNPPDEQVPWQAAFLDACHGLGYPSCQDANRAGTVGAGPHAMNKTSDHRRISVASAYLSRDVRARENLTILPDTTAWELLWRGNRCVGVLAESGQEPRDFMGDEVVLTLGAIYTPGLLLRSGVGPTDQLKGMRVAARITNDFVNPHLLDHPGFAMFCRKRWSAPIDRKHPLIQTMCRVEGTFDNDIVMQAGSKWVFPGLDLPGTSLMAMIGKPAGKGRLTFRSSNPHIAPSIQSALLDHDADRAMAVATLGRLYELSQTPQLQELATPILPTRRVLRDADKLDGWIRRFTDSGYHPCGTVPMGEEGFAACDGEGRVYGTEGLRVADASLFPTIPHANIHLTVIMVAERIAQMILG